jgi:hypothetical protein
LLEFFDLTGRKRNIKDLISLIMGLIVFAHIFGCLWHYLGIIEVETLKRDDTWLHSSEIIENNNWFFRYITSFYFALVTTTSVGYGDILPKNEIEKGFISCALLVAGIVFAYVINSIGSIMEDIKLEEKVNND